MWLDRRIRWCEHNADAVWNRNDTASNTNFNIRILGLIMLDWLLWLQPVDTHKRYATAATANSEHHGHSLKIENGRFPFF
jgi:hypothetical protein